MLQHIFITNARKKHPYESLLLDTFTSEKFNDSYLKFTKSKRIDKKLIYNILEVANEHKKYFSDMRTKREKEQFLRNQLTEQNNRDANRLKALYPTIEEIIFE